MIDIHCHILPCIDDGAKDIDVSLEMLRVAEEDGINKVIATPHFYFGHFENEYKKVEKSVGELNNIARENGINVEVLPGQEVFLDKYTLQNYKEGVIRGLNGTNYMLIELPPMQLPSYALDTIYELKLLGVKPIIAHPERYDYVINDITILNKFIEEKCFFQINSGSITGVFGKQVEKTAMKLIKNRICDFIASDAHTLGKRCPKIRESLMAASKENKQIYEKIIHNTSVMSKGEEIRYINGKMRLRRSILSIFT